MVFKVSEICCETIRQDTKPELSDIKITTAEVLNQSVQHAYPVAMIFCLGHCSQENGDTSAKTEGCPVVQ
jgi:hypothetical protein